MWAEALEALKPPSVTVADPDNDAPVKRISSDELKQLGQNMTFLWNQYRSDRRIAELRWLRNLRQYLGLYDPELEKELSPNRSKAYPKITRVKCVSVLSRIMDLMFPSDDRNWTLTASPNPDMSVKDVQKAIAQKKEEDQEAGVTSDVDLDYVKEAVQCLADEQAKKLSTLIDDQLEELGGDQSLDYIQLNRQVIQSGILYGLGVLRGPYARSYKQTIWDLDPNTQIPTPKAITAYKPMFEFLNIWDFYPDMSAKAFHSMDGYFTRTVMSRSQVRSLADREDFFRDQVILYLNRTPVGNYRPQPFEWELRAMGVKVNVNELKTETKKYEVITWHGPVSGELLRLAGCDVADDKVADEIDAEVWMIDGFIIKATINPWKSLGIDVRTVHTFLFDEDDTSPVGQGLPNILRDTQMSIAACTRMMLDNASITCGPQLELNTDLLRADQDLASTSAYKIWYREGTGPEAQYPAVRNVSIDNHIAELERMIDMFMKFADAETFVGPATGGDMERTPSEPFRTAAGASMLRGDAALPFKDIIRNFDKFTESVILSLVQFNRKFNEKLAEEADYNVIARGATSLIAKEVRGMQVDMLAQTLRPEEMLHVDERKLAEARFAVRDMDDLLVSEEEADRRKKAQDQQQAQVAQGQQEFVEANVRKLLSDAFKNIAQGQKNQANADAATVDAALKILEKGLTSNEVNAARPPGATDQTNPGGNGQQPAPSLPGADNSPAIGGQGQISGQPPSGVPSPAG